MWQNWNNPTLPISLPLPYHTLIPLPYIARERPTRRRRTEGKNISVKSSAKSLRGSTHLVDSLLL
eukprot:12047285-Prorocentrum_lima.AAC.1